MNRSVGIATVTPNIATLTPAFDPFRYGVELPHELVFHPLGFRTRLITNSREVVRAAEDSWRGFPSLFHDRTLEIRAVVSDNESAPCPTTLGWQAQRNLLTLVSDRDNFAVCDLHCGFAFWALAPATTHNHGFMRRFYLDPIIQILLWQTHLARIHAACVARDGRGVLLCAPSGMGKTCLSYACARRGWTFITDESTSIPWGARFALGKPHQVHFRETAVDILPELRGRLVSRNVVGKLGIEIHTSELSDIHVGFQCDVAAVVFLNRSERGPARLAAVCAECAFERLEQDIPLLEEPVYHRHCAALRHLIGAGAYELKYSDLDDAVRALEPLAGSAR